MAAFCFTVDDNIRFLKEITENRLESVFEHPYLAMYQRLHEAFNLKVQLNLFYRMGGFDLSMVPDTYSREFAENAHWLKLSFHADLENARPYEFSGYDEVYRDCQKVHEQIKRFASPASLAKTTTVHYCLTTEDGLQALKDHQMLGLLGLFGNSENPITSYGVGDGEAVRIRNGEIVPYKGIAVAAIDVVLNSFNKSSILKQLEALKDREYIKVMIHEQYFYPDYKAYQPEFEDKLRGAFAFMKAHGFESAFLEDLL